MTKKEPSWRICEETKKIEYERKGCYVETTGRGHDFKAICPDKKLTYVEVKESCGPLSKFQRKTRDAVIKSGLEYKIERCACPRREYKKREILED